MLVLIDTHKLVNLLVIGTFLLMCQLVESYSQAPYIDLIAISSKVKDELLILAHLGG